jgi:glycosyltransferase involved in cell wall biosynthesis
VHVCFFNRSYWPDQAATGQLLTELAEGLVADHGCRATVVAGRPLNAAAGASGTATGICAREQRRGVTIWRANGTSFRPGRIAGRAVNYLTYLSSAHAASFRVDSPDVVVSLTDPPVIGLAALMTAKRTGARFVYVCEDIFPDVAALLADFRNPVVNHALDRVNRFLLRKADAVVALGDRMRARLVEEKGADPARVHVIHNWIDADAIVPGSKDNAFARVHQLDGKFVVMHSGNVGMSQNLEVLIAAADRLRSRERLLFLIVGDGSMRPSLEREAARRSLANVRFLPYQPKDRLDESFASADAFVVGLKRGVEGYIVPSKVYGILAAGRPYIAAVDPSSEAASIARDHDCGLLATPGDAEDLAAKIAALHDDPEAARRMGANARAAAPLFDRRRAVRTYFDLLRAVSGGVPA